ncbi:hypothetical protein, partial [Amycolatopsis sp. H20-H5]|uniref:hypothetical protein n=1 Tax=Amycolatopsis sp. H20-H5 TaxID=3046309 RepID=UPI002DBD9053
LAAATPGTRLVVNGPAAASELVAALLSDVGVPSRATEARHCAVSGLLSLTELVDGGPTLLVSVSEHGHLAALAIK